MKYWLMKSEPSTFGIDHLLRSPKQTTQWEGVRNYQARNFMRDEMKVGDQAFFYHSSCEQPGIMGIMEVIKDAHPDLTALNPESKYYDPKSSKDNPRWFLVTLRLLEKFKNPIFLSDLKQNPSLDNMIILKPGNRLSITPVTKHEWNAIVKLRERLRTR